ncbi:hypothetical protein ACP70R_005647 [Stipagrostis hirtigluma subsp. patula]
MASLVRWRKMRSILHILKPKAAPPPQQLPALADDLLEEIFLRVASPADLVRAAAACAAFRRVILHASFLRRHRSLHPPLLLGVLCAGRPGPADFQFQPAEAPHPSARAGHDLACAAGFSFAYLPPRDWDPCDARDGRVLLKSGPAGYDGVVLALVDLAVCDPLFQRYLLLPPIPNDLLASVQLLDQDPRCFEPLLAPSGDDEDETSFRVIAIAYCTTRSVVFVYSTGSGSWSLGSSTSWDDTLLPLAPECNFERHHYVNGCFFWRSGCGNKLIKLAVNTMEFTTIDLLPGHDGHDIVVVEAGEGRLAVYSQISRGTICSYTMMENEGERADEWQMQSMIPLPSEYNCYIKGAAEGYIFLVGVPKSRKVRAVAPAVCFSLEIKTSKIERVCRICDPNCYFFPYFGFPPSLSPRRI